MNDGDEIISEGDGDEPTLFDSPAVSDDAGIESDDAFAAPEAAADEKEVGAAPAPVVTAAPEADDDDKVEVAAPVKKPKAAPKSAQKVIARELTPEQSALPWYVVHTYSGYEMRAKLSLEERIRSHGVDSKFGQILVPQETVVELVRGQKKTSKRKFFPGYILVQANLDDESWHLVKDTPKVTGFVGDSRNPSPITQEEVDNLTKQMEGGAQKPRPKVHFEEGDAVKVVDGPFADFNGTVDEVKADKGKLRVLISIFGRNTPVELDFVQVEKA